MAFIDPKIGISLLLLTTAAFFLGLRTYQKSVEENLFRDKDLLNKGLNLPVIWLYYDNSDVNSRWWADFGARSTRALNLPFLNLCFQSIVMANHGRYRVEVINGLTDFAQRLGGWEEMPRGLRNPLAKVNAPALNWIRATTLAKWGGLWVHPATICLKAFPELPEDGSAVFYGTDPDESYSGAQGTAVPSMYVMGCKNAGNPIFVNWSGESFRRLEAQGGGGEVRGDAKWDFVSFASGQAGVQLMPTAELSRKKNGKRIQIEDLLASGQEGVLPFNIPASTVYVPIPWPELRDRRMFGWFLRSSEDQILNSDLVIRYLFDMALEK